MRKSQESLTLHGRVEQTADFWLGTNHSRLHLQASLAGIIQLDEKYHLEGVVQHLRQLQGILFQTALALPLPPDMQDQYLVQWELLGDLADEFTWQSSFGIRLYEPL